MTDFPYHVAKSLITRSSVRESVRLSFDIHDGIACRVKHLATTPNGVQKKIFTHHIFAVTSM